MILESNNFQISVFSCHWMTSKSSHNSKLNANINRDKIEVVRERGCGSGLMCSCPKALSVFDKICVTRLSTIVVSKPHLYFISGYIQETRKQKQKTLKWRENFTDSVFPSMCFIKYHGQRSLVRLPVSDEEELLGI